MLSRPKRVAVYLDYSARKELELMQLSPLEILKDVTCIFTHINDIPFGYDLDFLPVMNWGHDIHSELMTFSSLNSDSDLDEKKAALPAEQRIAEKIVQIYESVSTDVVFFFSGLVGCSSGLVPDYYFNRGNGNGPAFIGVGGMKLRNARRSGRVVSDSNVLAAYDNCTLTQYLQAISGVCAHEQGHLLGLEHSGPKDSLMHEFSPTVTKGFSPKARKLDENSIKILRKKFSDSIPA